MFILLGLSMISNKTLKRNKYQTFITAFFILMVDRLRFERQVKTEYDFKEVVFHFLQYVSLLVHRVDSMCLGSWAAVAQG